MYILKPPCGRNFIHTPSFMRPPPLEGYFLGLGGGYIKIWPRKAGSTQKEFEQTVCANCRRGTEGGKNLDGSTNG